MGARKIRQRELFDDGLAVRQVALPAELRQELLEILTQWLCSLGERMVQEAGNEQDLR